jgi:hypothetical protein
VAGDKRAPEGISKSSSKYTAIDLETKIRKEVDKSLVQHCIIGIFSAYVFVI